MTVGRDDRGEVVEIEVGDGLEGFGGGAVAEAVRQRIGPGGILGLQGEQLGDAVTPAPGAARRSAGRR